MYCKTQSKMQKAYDDLNDGRVYSVEEVEDI